MIKTFYSSRLLYNLLFFIIISFLTACSKPPNFWYLEENRPLYSQYHTCRLSLPPLGLVKNVSVELISSNQELRLYINLLLFPLNYNEKIIQLRYTVGPESGEVTAFVMEGGQRILLPCELRDSIIEGLLRGAPVFITIRNFKFEIPSSNFSELYYRMK